ncbi:MAG: tetratricopeptide repeat protein [Flavobacteriales bacterium]|nr:tetratricopeptide repeat protein [Flavobacteriales bacterium]
MNQKAWIFLALGLSVLVAVAAFQAPRSLPESFLQKKEEQKLEEELKTFRESAYNDLDAPDRIRVRMWRKKLQAGEILWADSLAAFWMQRNQPLLVCDALAEKATASDEVRHYEAAFDMLNGALDVVPEDQMPLALAAMKRLAKKAMERDSAMASAQVAMAIVETREGGAPMKGIRRLLQVLEKDPANIKAMLQLGHFSIMSGQADKALQRYLQAWQVAPGDASVAFYVAETYARLSQTDSARSWLKRVLALEKVPRTRASVELYFQENYNISIAQNRP